MGMIQNSFANSSFSLLVGKVQGTIVDYLMPPISDAELMLAMVGSAVTRAFMVGGAVWLAMALWPGVSVMPAALPVAILFGFLGSAFVSLFGLLTSIWSEKFDHAAAVTNFVIAPARFAIGHILFNRTARSKLSGDQSRQPVLLHHIGLSLRLFGALGFRYCDGRRHTDCASTLRLRCWFTGYCVRAGNCAPDLARCPILRAADRANTAFYNQICRICRDRQPSDSFCRFGHHKSFRAIACHRV